MHNYLRTLYAPFDGMAKRFRKHVCWALGWSEPTFYRRYASGEPFTPAEKFMITQVAKATLLKLVDFIDQAEKDPNFSRVTGLKSLMEAIHFPLPPENTKTAAVTGATEKKGEN